MGKNLQSQLIFLGTGTSSLVIGSQARASGGLVLQTDGFQFHIDPGPGALVRARQFNVNPRENTAVFVTHNHLSHCNDINAVISAMTHAGEDKKGVLVCNKTLYEGHEDLEPYLTKHHRDYLERTIVLNTGQKVGIEEIEVHAIKAIHSDPHTIGLKFITPKFTLVYSSDTKFDESILEDYKNADILVLNNVCPFSVKGNNNLNSEDTVEIINAVKPKIAVIQHFGVKMLAADPLYEAREIKKQTNIPIIAAKDGMAINPITFSSSFCQKAFDV